MNIILFILQLFSSPVILDSTYSYYGYGMPLNNKNYILIRYDANNGIHSAGLEVLEDSLGCTKNKFCSERRSDYEIKYNLNSIKLLDSLIFSKICGASYHVATKKDLNDSYWMFPKSLSSYNGYNGAFYGAMYSRIVFFDEDSNTYVQSTSSRDNIFFIDYGAHRIFSSSIYGDTLCDNVNNTSCLNTGSNGSTEGIVYPLVGAEPFLSTVCVSNYLLDSSQIARIVDTLTLIKTDTIFKIDYVTKKDTISIIKKDTVNIIKTDTIKTVKTVRDTITLHTLVHDTIKINVPFKDTVIKNVYKIDTLKLNDTVNSCKIDPTYTYYSLYNSKHMLPTMRGMQLFESNDSITWKNGSDNKTQNDFTKTVSIKIEANTGLDISVYIYDNTGVFVNSFEGKINPKSNNVKYLTWGGMTADGKRVVDGVYVIRVLIRDGNRIANNVYKVGVER